MIFCVVHIADCANGVEDDDSSDTSLSCPVQVEWSASLTKDGAEVVSADLDLTSQLERVSSAVKCAEGQRFCSFSVPLIDDNVGHGSTSTNRTPRWVLGVDIHHQHEASWVSGVNIHQSQILLGIRGRHPLITRPSRYLHAFEDLMILD